MKILAAILLLLSTTYSEAGYVTNLDDYSSGDYYINQENVYIQNIDLDKTITVSFKDGREAVLAKPKETQSIAFAEIQFNENTCIEEPTVNQCKLMVPHIENRLKLIWSKHSDKTKIGKAVQEKIGTQVRDFKLNLDMVIDNGYEAITELELSKDVKDELFYQVNTKPDPMSIKCEKKINFVDTDKQIVISEWAVEIIQENNETRVSENMTTGSFFDLSFNTDKEGKELLLNSVGFVPMRSRVSSIFLGSIIGFSYNSNNKICEGSFNLSPESLFNSLREEKTTKYLPIILRKDALMKQVANSNYEHEDKNIEDLNIYDWIDFFRLFDDEGFEEEKSRTNDDGTELLYYELNLKELI